MTDPVTITGQDGAPYLAVDIQPDVVRGVFTLDRSLLNGPDRLARSDNDANLWENVVCDVQSVSARRGVTQLQGLLSQAEAGTCTVVVSDTRRTFDPTVNWDTVHKSTPLRLRAWGSDQNGDLWEAVLWTGEIDQLHVQYHPDDPPTVTITGVDIIGVLAAWEAEGRPVLVGAGDSLRERVSRALAEVGRGSIAAGSDNTYAATLTPIPLARPWEDICAGVEAELGRLWVNSANQLVVRARGAELSGTVRGTLSDLHGETDSGVHCCLADADVVYGWETAGNRVLARREQLEGEPPDTAQLARRDYVGSQVRYGVGVIRRDDLHLQTDVQAALWAEAVVVAHGQPRLRVDQVTPLPSPQDLDNALQAWPAVCRTDIGDRWLFRHRPQTGPAVRRAVGVLGIELDMTPDAWSVVWTTTEAPTPGRASSSGWFVVGESKLNSGDVIAPYRVRV